jgi:uncharacterized membrane protein
MPLHPAIVHLPLGLALVLPWVAAFAAWRRFQGERVATYLVLLLALMLLGGNIAARQTGEGDEEIVEKVVAHAVIEHHEEAADAFGVTVLVVLALSIATVALGARKQARWAAVAVVVASLFTATSGIKTGHDGGEIVYEHGGASAHAKAAAPAPAAGDSP